MYEIPKKPIPLKIKKKAELTKTAIKKIIEITGFLDVITSIPETKVEKAARSIKKFVILNIKLFCLLCSNWLNYNNNYKNNNNYNNNNNNNHNYNYNYNYYYNYNYNYNYN
jgi:S-adenosylmethionine hydrolase